MSDVGHLTNDWIGEPVESTAPFGPTTVPAPVFRNSTDVTWVNDALSTELPSLEEALAQVWERHESGDKYVQASRLEIAGALPGVEFPERLPDDVRFLSSQLLFDGDGTLANDFIAAFGLWTAEPYTVSRSVGQYGILWVTYPDPDRSGCDRFSGRDITSCETVLFEGATRWRLESGGEQTVVWMAGDYQYELFHRKQISPEMALELASRTVPLETIDVPAISDVSSESTAITAGS